MLIVTYINYNRVNFALTWVRHLRAQQQPHHLVAALDRQALLALEARGVPSYLLNFSTLSGSDTGWGTGAFRQLGLFKVQMVLELAKTGVDTLTVDADAFILRDPMPYFRQLPQADVLMSSVSAAATLAEDAAALPFVLPGRVCCLGVCAASACVLPRHPARCLSGCLL